MWEFFLVFQGQHRSGRSGSGRHRTSRSPERQHYSQQYSQQQAEHLRRKQQQHQGQPRQQHPQQHQYPQQYGGAGKWYFLVHNDLKLGKNCNLPDNMQCTNHLSQRLKSTLMNIFLGQIVLPNYSFSLFYLAHCVVCIL